jgi:hypothetical protein
LFVQAAQIGLLHIPHQPPISVAVAPARMITMLLQWLQVKVFSRSVGASGYVHSATP